MINISLSGKNVLKVLPIVFSILLIWQLSVVDTASALTRYFNCVTKSANHNSTLSLENAMVCYDKVFKGASDNDEYGGYLSN